MTDTIADVGKNKTVLRSTASGDVVTFDVTPVIAESRSIGYDTYDTVHLPTEILSFRSTSARAFNMSDIKLVSRTPAEARKNLIRLNQLRAWAMPYFGVEGKSTYGAASEIDRLKENFRKLIGAPPDVLLLYAHVGNTDSMIRVGNINGVPVAMTNIDFSYPNDVDYIPCGGDPTGGGSDPYINTPFPTIMHMTLSLKEIHSPKEIERFSIDDYRKGLLPRF